MSNSGPVNGLSKLFERTQARNEYDAVRYKEHDSDLCMLCYAYGEDKRSLFIDCVYAVYEVVPEVMALDNVDNTKLNNRGFYLLICKSCRARLLGRLQGWRNECVALRDLPKNHDGYLEEVYDDPNRNIPVRINGATTMMTLSEYEQYNSTP